MKRHRSIVPCVYGGAPLALHSRGTLVGRLRARRVIPQRGTVAARVPVRFCSALLCARARSRLKSLHAGRARCRSSAMPSTAPHPPPRGPGSTHRPSIPGAASAVSFATPDQKLSPVSCADSAWNKRCEEACARRLDTYTFVEGITLPYPKHGESKTPNEWYALLNKMNGLYLRDKSGNVICGQWYPPTEKRPSGQLGCPHGKMEGSKCRDCFYEEIGGTSFCPCAGGLLQLAAKQNCGTCRKLEKKDKYKAPFDTPEVLAKKERGAPDAPDAPDAPFSLEEGSGEEEPPRKSQRKHAQPRHAEGSEDGFDYGPVGTSPANVVVDTTMQDRAAPCADDDMCDSSCKKLGYILFKDEMESCRAYMRKIIITSLNSCELRCLEKDMETMEYLSHREGSSGGESAQSTLRNMALVWTLRLLKSPTPNGSLKKVWKCTRRAGIALTNYTGHQQPWECVLALWANASGDASSVKMETLTDMFFENLGQSVASVCDVDCSSTRRSMGDYAFMDSCQPFFKRVMYHGGFSAETAYRLQIKAVVCRPNNTLMLSCLSSSSSTADVPVGEHILSFPDLSEKHLSLLEFAIRNDDSAAATMLVNMGANPMIKGSHGVALLRIASRVGNSALVNVMLNESIKRCCEKKNEDDVSYVFREARAIVREALTGCRECMLYTVMNWLKIHTEKSPFQNVLNELQDPHCVEISYFDTERVSYASAVVFVLDWTSEWTPTMRANMIHTLLNFGYRIFETAGEQEMLDWGEDDWTKKIAMKPCAWDNNTSVKPLVKGILHMADANRKDIQASANNDAKRKKTGIHSR